MAGFGLWRLPAEASRDVPDVRLRIMQPNLPQDAKFNPRNRERHHAALPGPERQARLERR